MTSLILRTTNYEENMNYSDLLKISGLTALITLVMTLLVIGGARTLRAWLQRRLPLRYLQPQGTWRRSKIARQSKRDIQNDPDQQQQSNN